MFSYYGSKSKVVNYYPYPKCDKIVEPFAGSARYSLKHFEKDILLVDTYDIIVKIWHYLQEASEQDIMGLSEPKLGETINRDDFDCIEQAWLMGFLVQQGVNAPRLTVTKYAVDGIRTQKKNIAGQLYKIKHWEIKKLDYREILNIEATWFIDPPYQFGGEWYVKNNKKIDYNKLAEWCKSRDGQIIVCENSKASWMPFKQMADLNGSKYKTTEVIWSNLPTVYDNEQMQMFAAT